MRNRLWLNLLMLLLAGILILVVIYEPGKQPEPVEPKLTSLRADDISHILISRTTGEDIELAKQNGRWQMLKPYHLPANDFRVRSLLRLSETESKSDHDLGKLNPATYGLDKPRASVTFNHKTKIIFGKTEPLQHHRYVQIGNRLHTIFDTFYYQATGSVSMFLDHSLLPPDAKITRLVLPDLQLQLENGQWQRTPPHAELSADASVELINNWRHAQAQELRTGGDTKTKAGIEIYLQDRSEPLRFHLQHREDEYLLTRLDNGLQYVFAEDVGEQLLTLPKTDPAEEKK